ncbi:MAG TPA: sucrose synthase, partial [Candidatus Marinimicrobia bacterium]|nr:sucrose synthase [Candidatus Neomarinimicrobiota bacterium]
MARHDGKILLQNDLLLIFKDFCAVKNLDDAFLEDSSVAAFLKRVQEIIIRNEYMALMYRHGIGKYRFYMLRQYGEYMEIMAPGEYLDIKDTQVSTEGKILTPLHIDFMPFYDFSPSIRDTRSVGNGIRYLNRYLSSHLFQNPKEWNEKLFNFIKMHSHNGFQLLVNGGILTHFDTFYNALDSMIETLSKESADTPHSEVEPILKKEGFEPGWGNTAGRIVETMQLLYDLINEPDDSLLEAFITRVPMPHISKIAIISPHGWFGQEDVLGKPDTGGQVIYILDQVRALEKYLKESLRLSGLDIDPRIIVIT